MPNLSANGQVTEDQTRLLTALVDQTPDLIARLDCGGRYLYLNRSAKGAFGSGDMNYLGRTADELGFSEQVIGAYGLALRALSTDGIEGQFNFQLRINDKTRYFDVRVVPECDGCGRLSSLLMIARDVTHRIDVEVERDAALARERQARHDASEKLAALAATHRQMLAEVSHELRSPLNGIQSWAHVLESCIGSDGGTVRRALTGIRAGVDQQVRLINDLLESGTTNRGK